jgi:hypothetical protein
MRMAGTPKALTTLPSESARSVKGSLYLSLKAFWEAGLSMLTPRTVTPLAWTSAHWSRSEQACLVQPGVSALG